MPVQVDKDVQDVARERGWTLTSKPLLQEHVMSWRLGRNLEHDVYSGEFGI
jgi:hypothetical protein